MSASVLRLFFHPSDPNLDQRAPQLDNDARVAMQASSFSLIGPVMNAFHGGGEGGGRGGITF
jgi:hypothetical protein